MQLKSFLVTLTEDAFVRSSELTCGAFKLYTLYMLACQNRIFPLTRELAMILGVTRQQIYRWRKELIAKQWLFIEPDGGPSEPGQMWPMVGMPVDEQRAATWASVQDQEGWLN